MAFSPTLIPPVQIVHLYNSCVVRGGGHVDDSGGASPSSGLLQQVQEQVGQQEVAEVIEAEVELEAVLRLSLWNQHGTS